jgi:thiamine pyrophosphate-dependent acetolactate synthase large subunit-like protein
MMKPREALEILAKHRGKRVAIATMSACAVWPQLSDTPLDFIYIPSAMGHAPALGLGIALAQPQRGALVLNGDGCMLMSLGSLVTLANHPADVVMIIMDNGHYEVTGGQPHAGAGHVDYCAMARAAGIGRVYTFDTLEAWRSGVAEALTGKGPTVIWLKVEGKMGQKTPKPPRPMVEQIARLRQALHSS